MFQLSDGRTTTPSIWLRNRKRSSLVANSVPSLGKVFVSFPAQGLTVARPRDHNGIKRWQVFSIRKSAMTTIRKHFESDHPGHWESERSRLHVPLKDATGEAPVPDVEPFTRDGVMIRLVRFVTNFDEVRHRPFLISSPFTDKIM